MMKVVLLLALLTVSEGDGTTVVGRTGGRVTLSCKYDIKSHGALHVCWGRGEIPTSKCSNQLIATDGHKVTEGTRVSSRYQLLGRLEDGDVSLTIEDVSKSDAGRYGCRVEIPGWSNDKKYHFDLVVEKAPQTTTSTTSTRETATEQTAASYTAGHVTSTDHLLTSSSSSITAEGSSGVSVALVCVLVGLVFLVTAAVIFIAHRRRRLGKIPQQQVHSTVQFRST
ncbi:hepatitis A virus cellular receptor 1 homolog [Anoplopoma fimbria]|uniref:hepatitis A virus cellular receptor 1 homolog n=1 Tax=Anoplopoma fimbria TaxID=229290 RepID=UPI0023EDB151|nr:hepatitis A virus cellular receptor 1 homolog [Anoplopoma fimbria]